MLDQIVVDHPGKRIETYFRDEARFGQQGTLVIGWARRIARDLKAADLDNLTPIQALDLLRKLRGEL